MRFEAVNDGTAVSIMMEGRRMFGLRHDDLDEFYGLMMNAQRAIHMQEEPHYLSTNINAILYKTEARMVVSVGNDKVSIGYIDNDGSTKKKIVTDFDGATKLGDEVRELAV